MRDRKKLKLGFVDVILMFFKEGNFHIETCMEMLHLCTFIFDLHVNIDKSTFIDLTLHNFEAFIWHGKKLPIDHFFKYPIGMIVLHWVGDGGGDGLSH